MATSAQIYAVLVALALSQVARMMKVSLGSKFWLGLALGVVAVFVPTPFWAGALAGGSSALLVQVYWANLMEASDGRR